MPSTLVYSLAAGTTALAAATWLLADAALRPESQLFGPTIVAGNDPSAVALTYDDGPNDAPHHDGTAALLDTLAAHNARATFFLLGKFVRQRPALARRIHAEGHLIGNHTETHPWLHTKSSAVICQELRACNQALEDALGIPIHYFRPPHGARRPAVLQAAASLGLKTVQWNVMGTDWLPIGPARILANIDQGMARARRLGRSSNILLHDGSDRALGTSRADTILVTATLLERFALNGTRTVTVDAWA
jgi:peptidoglycan/xylan/chitin deacetylase (PgdA/CDA1 family)